MTKSTHAMQTRDKGLPDDASGAKEMDVAVIQQQQRRSTRLAQKEKERSEGVACREQRQSLVLPRLRAGSPSGSHSTGSGQQWGESFFASKPSVALKSGLVHDPQGKLSGSHQEKAAVSSNAVSPIGDISGLWGMLPEEVRRLRCALIELEFHLARRPLQLVETILKLCVPSQLGMLQSTCSYFRNSKLIDKIAKHKLKAVPRAKGLKPQKR